MLRCVVATFVLVCPLISCGPDGPRGEPSRIPTREARIDLTIGAADGDGPEVFGRIGGLLELSDGRILVADMLAHEIRVFAPSGDFLFRFGREGQGPGDLGGPCCLALGPDGLVWTREASNGRYSAFRVLADTAEYVRAVTQQHGAAGLMAPTTFDAAGLLVDVGARPAEEGGFERARFHMGGRGEIVETEVAIPAALTDLGSHQVRGMIGGEPALLYLWQPFASRALGAHGPDGRLAMAVSGRYEVEVRQGSRVDTLHGDVLEGPALSAEEREAGREAMERDAGRAGLRASDLPYGLPERRPPLEQIQFDDDGRLWVELSVPRDSARIAEVWSRDGALVERVSWPHEARLGLVSWIGDGRALGVQRDELGVERVVRLRWE